ncbi:hypothetical protein LXA28_18415, partial [Erwinia amylovora]|nr:hypothetical protein [Erwinia amylovora]
LDHMEWNTRDQPITTGKALWQKQPVMKSTPIKRASDSEIKVKLLKKNKKLNKLFFKIPPHNPLKPYR